MQPDEDVGLKMRGAEYANIDDLSLLWFCVAS